MISYLSLVCMAFLFAEKLKGLMKMKQKYLPGTVRERIQDLMKQSKLTQSELAKRIDIAESTLSRFISGRTDKLGNESIMRIAEIFNVSTDFLLGITDEPDRKNYDVSELGLSVEAARNLYTGRVNAGVVNRLLTDPHFAEATYLISRYLNDTLAVGFAAQNQLYDSVTSLMNGNKQAIRDIFALKTPLYQADLSAIQRQFMAAVKEIKKNADTEIEQTKKIQKDIFDKMVSELTKGQDIQKCKITPEDIADTVAESVSCMNGVTEEIQGQIKQLFLSITGGASNENV